MRLLLISILICAAIVAEAQNKRKGSNENSLDGVPFKERIVIAYVPSSNSTKTVTSIRKVAESLASVKDRINGTSCVVRHTTIAKAANGGNQSKQVHFDSIRIEHQEIIRGRTVVPLDDVTTSGNSLIACKELLMNAGATKVVKTETKKEVAVAAPVASAVANAPVAATAHVSPVAARIMAEKGIAPTQVNGTGAGGKITKSDVLLSSICQKFAFNFCPIFFIRKHS